MHRKPNPFTPDRPVSPEYFAGRKDEIHKIEKAIERTVAGMAENVLVTGERGIGKSSLGRYARLLAEKRDFVTAFVPATDQMSISQLCYAIMRDLQENARKPMLREFMEGIRERVKISFPLGEVDLRTREPLDWAIEFAYLLGEFWDTVAKQYQGLFILVDELDRIALRQPELASFLKSLFEKLIVDGREKIMFAVIGSPALVESFQREHPSVIRSFVPIELE